MQKILQKKKGRLVFSLIFVKHKKQLYNYLNLKDTNNGDLIQDMPSINAKLFQDNIFIKIFRSRTKKYTVARLFFFYKKSPNSFFPNPTSPGVTTVLDHINRVNLWKPHGYPQENLGKHRKIRKYTSLGYITS